MDKMEMRRASGDAVSDSGLRETAPDDAQEYEEENNAIEEPESEWTRPAEETDETGESIGMDLSLFDFSEQAKNVRRQEIRSRLAVQKGRVKEKRRGLLQHVHPLTLLFCAAAVGLCVLTLMDYSRLTVLSDEISQKEKEVAELQKINQDLYAAEEGRYDLDEVKEKATKMGMAPMDAGQLEYVELDTEEIIHVVGSESRETDTREDEALSDGEEQAEKGLRRLWKMLVR